MFIEKLLILLTLIIIFFLHAGSPTYHVELCIIFGTGMVVGALGHIAKILTRR